MKQSTLRLITNTFLGNDNPMTIKELMERTKLSRPVIQEYLDSNPNGIKESAKLNPITKRWSTAYELTNMAVQEDDEELQLALYGIWNGKGYVPMSALLHQLRWSQTDPDDYQQLINDRNLVHVRLRVLASMTIAQFMIQNKMPRNTPELSTIWNEWATGKLRTSIKEAISNAESDIESLKSILDKSQLWESDSLSRYPINPKPEDIAAAKQTWTNP